jgi:hypothetical protein
MTDSSSSPLSPVDRFVRSQNLDYGQWREGEGYDLDALSEMTAAERDQVIEPLIPPRGWRDVEVLLAVDSARARDALHDSVRDGPVDVRLAIAQRAPQLVADTLKVEMLLQAIQTAEIWSGLSKALDQIETFHPPIIVDALFRALLEREGDVAYHCAAALAVIHRKIDSRMNWSMRPLFLRFNTRDLDAQREALRELRVRLELRGHT